MASRKIEVQIVGDARQLARTFDKAGKSAEGFGSRLGHSSRRIGRAIAGIGVAAAGIGVVTGRAFSSFEESLDRIVGLAGGSRAQVQKFGDEILRLAPTVAKSPQELAEALYFVASAGIAVSKQMGVVTVSAKASAAGLGDTQVVADAVTSAMNAYGSSALSAQKATDVLAATVREGKGEASAFAPVIGTVASIASNLGVSFNEVGAALAAMTRLGIPAEVASVQLQAVFSSLLKSTPKTAKALESVGLSHAGLRKQLKEKGLLSVLQTLKDSFGDNTAAMAEAFPNIRALRGLLALVGKNAEEVRGVFGRMVDSTGALGVAFGAVSKGEAFKFKQTMAALKVVGIRLGAVFAPVAKLVADGATKALTAVSDFIEKLGAAKTVRAKLDVVWEGIQASATALVRLVERALGAIDFGAVFSTVRDALARGATRLGEVFDRIDWNAIGKGLSDGIHSALAFLTSIDYGAVIRGVATRLRTALSGLVDAIDWGQLGRDIGNTLVAALNGIANFVNQTDWGKVGKALVEGFKKALAAFGSFLSGVNWLAVLGATFRAAVAVIRGFVVLFGTVAIELGKAILVGIGRGLLGLGRFVTAKMMQIPAALLGLAEQAIGWGAGIGKAIVRGIGNAVAAGANFVLQKVLALAIGVLGAFSFLGRFDPFKGLREKAKAKLDQMQADARTTSKGVQRSIDRIEDRRVQIAVETIVAPGEGRRAADGAAKSVRKHADAAEKATKDVRRTAERREAAVVSAAAAAEKATADAAAKVEAAAAKAEAARQRQEEAFARLLDGLNLNLEKAQATAKLGDDLRALGKIEEAIKARIRAEGRTVALERQLFQVRQQAAETRARQRDTKQFALLGLGPGGEEKIPGVKALRGQLGRITDAIKGTFLDTGKTKSLLQNIRKILSGQLGVLSGEVRGKIKDLLADLNQQLQAQDKVGQKLTKRRITAGKSVSAFGFNISQPVSPAAASGPPIHVHLMLDRHEIGNVVIREAQGRNRKTGGTRSGRHGGTKLF